MCDEVAGVGWLKGEVEVVRLAFFILFFGGRRLTEGQQQQHQRHRQEAREVRHTCLPLREGGGGPGAVLGLMEVKGRPLSQHAARGRRRWSLMSSRRRRKSAEVGEAEKKAEKRPWVTWLGEVTSAELLLPLLLLLRLLYRLLIAFYCYYYRLSVSMSLLLPPLAALFTAVSLWRPLCGESAAPN